MNTWKTGRISVKVGGLAAAPAVRDPQNDRAALQAIHAAAQARDFDRASALAEAALRDGLEHPMVLNLAALKLEKEERFGDALRVLHRAVELAPDDIPARNALGLWFCGLAALGALRCRMKIVREGQSPWPPDVWSWIAGTAPGDIWRSS